MKHFFNTFFGFFIIVALSHFFVTEANAAPCVGGSVTSTDGYYVTDFDFHQLIASPPLSQTSVTWSCLNPGSCGNFSAPNSFATLYQPTLDLLTLIPTYDIRATFSPSGCTIDTRLHVYAPMRNHVETTGTTCGANGWRVGDTIRSDMGSSHFGGCNPATNKPRYPLKMRIFNDNNWTTPVVPDVPIVACSGTYLDWVIPAGLPTGVTYDLVYVSDDFCEDGSCTVPVPQSAPFPWPLQSGYPAFAGINNSRLICPALAPAISVSPASLTYNIDQSSNADSTQNVTVTNTGGGNMNWSTSVTYINPASGTNFVTAITPSSGTNGQGVGSTVDITVNRSGLGYSGATPYRANVVFTCTNCVPVVTRTVAITLNVTIPIISVSPGNPINITRNMGTDYNACTSVSVSNIGSGTLTFDSSIALTSPVGFTNFFSTNPTSGTAPRSVDIRCLLATYNVPAGNYTGLLTISSTIPNVVPVTRTINLTVSAGPPDMVITPSSSVTENFACADPGPKIYDYTITNPGTPSLSYKVDFPPPPTGVTISNASGGPNFISGSNRTLGAGLSEILRVTVNHAVWPCGGPPPNYTLTLLFTKLTLPTSNLQINHTWSKLAGGPPPVNPVMSVTPANYTNTMYQGQSLNVNFSVSNTVSGSGTITYQASIQSPNPAGFSPTLSPPPMPVNGTASFGNDGTFTLSAPTFTAPGVYTLTVRVTAQIPPSPAGTSPVTIDVPVSITVPRQLQGWVFEDNNGNGVRDTSAPVDNVMENQLLDLYKLEAPYPVGASCPPSGECKVQSVLTDSTQTFPNPNYTYNFSEIGNYRLEVIKNPVVRTLGYSDSEGPRATYITTPTPTAPSAIYSFNINNITNGTNEIKTIGIDLAANAKAAVWNDSGSPCVFDGSDSFPETGFDEIGSWLGIEFERSPNELDSLDRVTWPVVSPVGSFNVFMNGMRPSSLGYTANFKIDAGMPDDLESNLRNTLPTTITRQENEDQFIIRRGETKNLTETNFLIPNCEERDFQL